MPDTNGAPGDPREPFTPPPYEPPGRDGPAGDDDRWEVEEEPGSPEWYRDHDPWDAPVAPAAARPASTRSSIGWGRLLAVSLLSSVLGAALAVGAVRWLGGDLADGGATVTIIERVETQILSPEESGTPASAVAQRVLPSIATIEVRESSDSTGGPDSSGSGVVIDASGLLVTNHHVVAGAGDVRVVFADGRIYEAEVIGSDALSDVALIEIDAAGLTAVELGSADALHIGDTAIAIGSPLGLEGGPSVTVGVVSAFDRRVQTSLTTELFGMLQTDAPITRGSSGGALVDGQGRLIGITTAIGISDVGAEGLGFAVPIDMVMRIVEDLTEYGQVHHAFLGIQGTTFFDDRPDGAVVPAGVVVSEVIADSAAAQAGLSPGDLLLSFDGDNLTTMEQLVVDVRFYKVGDAVEVVVNRDGEEFTVPVTLLERPEEL